VPIEQVADGTGTPVDPERFISDLATTLTVKFPTPLSNELTESALIDSALSRFIARK